MTTEIIQGSKEWHAIRLGKVTASNLSDVMAGGTGATRNAYMAKLIAERLTGEVDMSGFKSSSTEWGKETEAKARAAYEFKNNIDIVQVGFVDHPRIAMTGASPDGLVGDDGLVEFKCPNTSTHLDTLLGKKSLPGDYKKQMTWQLACTGRQWCDWNSFDPRLPDHLQLHTVRIMRDDAAIAEAERAVRAFLAEMEGKIAELDRLYARQAAE